MKRCLMFAVVFACLSGLAWPQGALLPAVPPAFTNASGLAAAGGKLCTIKAGTTTTWKATYADYGLTTPLPNPIALNGIGQATTNGTATTAIYLSGSGGGSYKLILYAAGVGNTCNGSAVGAAIWTRDNIYDVGQLIAAGLITLTSVNNRQYCVTGADFRAKFVAAAALLPSTGGIVDCSNLQGAQSFSTAIVFAKPIRLILGASTPTFTSSSGPAFTMYAGSIIEGLGIGTTTIKLSADGSSADAITPAANSIILNLTLQGNTSASPGASGIDGCNCTNVEVDGVEIKNFGGHGINTGGNDANGYWNIHNSYIHDNYDDGVLLGGVGGHNVHNNLIWSNGSNGIDSNSANNRFEDDDIYNNGANYVMANLDANGIVVTSIGSGNADFNIIHHNQFRRNQGSQVKIRADASGHTNGTVVSANIMSGGVAATTASILVDTSVGAGCGQTDNTHIDGNTVSNSTGQGILIGGGSGTPCTANGSVVTTNILSGNTGVSIQVAYGTGATLVNNTMYGNGTDAPSLGGSTQNFECDRLSISSATLTCSAGTISANLLTVTSTLMASQQAQINGEIQYAPTNTTLATGANNNVAAANISWIRVTGPSGGFSISGFSGGQNGQILYVYNTTAQQMTLTNAGAGSSSGNKIATLTGADVVLRAGTSFANFVYDSANAVWDLVGTN